LAESAEQGSAELARWRKDIKGIFAGYGGIQRGRSFKGVAEPQAFPARRSGRFPATDIGINSRDQLSREPRPEFSV
jgi:hypothetical protein